ncbi:hypothetical protein [Olleya namhaensis]|uniref:Uncharacterized protein n=1 Tax=Olleya namhaensis TaxID=1144750 RepID=A0A1I3QE77_9FLAO|nr:hypothetical protein [Olleya namhaensis]SFJ32030.1 hypothetical protein SAMN05443431_10694 [Olleya namhaensis]
MKKPIFFFALLLVLLMSCNQKSYTVMHADTSVLTGDEVAYHLSKDLLKLEIIYTLNEPKLYKTSANHPLISNNAKVTIEDPIKITKLLVADTSQTFFITGQKLSDAFFVNTGETAQNSIAKDTVIIDANHIKKGNTLSFLTDSNIEVGAYNSVLEIKNNISKITTKDEAEFTLELLHLYKKQSIRTGHDVKRYIKKTKLKYTVIIDPSQRYANQGHWSEIKNDKIYHTIAPDYLFGEQVTLNDVVTLEFPMPKTDSLPSVSTQKPLEGVVYRSLPAVNFTLSLNDTRVASDSLSLTQLGTLKTMSVKDLERSNEASVLLFKSTKQEKTFKTEEKMEQLEYDSSKAIEASQIAIKSEYKAKLNDIDALIKTIETRKSDL